jgi:hypothetical protein
MKVYVVNKEHCSGESNSTDLEKIFTTLEKANNYIAEMEIRHKDSFGFQYKWYYWDVEEVEVE